MLQVLISALPLAFLWLILSRQVTLPVFIAGYAFGLMTIVILRVNSSFESTDQPILLRTIPSQIIAILRYAVLLVIEIFVSGIDVALRVLAREVNVKPAIYRISTQDATNNEVISALSAHGITITPGTLVIDYEVENGQTMMIVHTLDNELWDEQSQIDGQTERLGHIQRMLGQ